MDILSKKSQGKLDILVLFNTLLFHCCMILDLPPCVCYCICYFVMCIIYFFLFHNYIYVIYLYHIPTSTSHPPISDLYYCMYYSFKPCVSQLVGALLQKKCQSFMFNHKKYICMFCNKVCWTPVQGNSSLYYHEDKLSTHLIYLYL